MLLILWEQMIYKAAYLPQLRPFWQLKPSHWLLAGQLELLILREYSYFEMKPKKFQIELLAARIYKEFNGWFTN